LTLRQAAAALGPTGTSVKREWSLQNDRPVPGTRHFAEGIVGRPSRGARCRIVVISVLRDGLRAWIARLVSERRKSSSYGTDHFKKASTLAREGGLWCTGLSGGESLQTISEDRDDYITRAHRARNARPASDAKMPGVVRQQLRFPPRRAPRLLSIRRPVEPAQLAKTCQFLSIFPIFPLIPRNDYIVIVVLNSARLGRIHESISVHVL
jgi:hypothetical protein